MPGSWRSHFWIPVISATRSLDLIGASKTCKRIYKQRASACEHANVLPKTRKAFEEIYRTISLQPEPTKACQSCFLCHVIRVCSLHLNRSQCFNNLFLSGLPATIFVDLGLSGFKWSDFKKTGCILLFKSTPHILSLRVVMLTPSVTVHNLKMETPETIRLSLQEGQWVASLISVTLNSISLSTQNHGYTQDFKATEIPFILRSNCLASPQPH